MQATVPRLTEALSKRPEFAHVADDLRTKGRKLWLEINRDAAGKLGISMQDRQLVDRNSAGVAKMCCAMFDRADKIRKRPNKK